MHARRGSHLAVPLYNVGATVGIVALIFLSAWRTVAPPNIYIYIYTIAFEREQSGSSICITTGYMTPRPRPRRAGPRAGRGAPAARRALWVWRCRALVSVHSCGGWRGRRGLSESRHRDGDT
jgi:hypothetical protein